MIPLYITTQIRKVDSDSINNLKIPSIVLMENAARSLFAAILSRFEINEKTNFAILCGKGNNGGDGFALARHLINFGSQVKVFYFFPPEQFSNDAKVNFEILKNFKCSNFKLIFYRGKNDLAKIKNCNCVIDAMLGSGSKGELKEPFLSVVNLVNKLEATRIAIDQPTGLDVDTGFGENIFNADLTLTLAAYKRGLFFGRGYECSGEVERASIGTDVNLFEKISTKEFLIEPEDAHQLLPQKNKSLNKYSAGKVFSIAGSGKYPGAAILTSVSALRVGCGASIIAFPNSIKAFVHKKYPELVSIHYNDEKKEFFSVENLHEVKEKIEWADCVAIGPGLGREASTENAIHQILKNYTNKFMVLDADALYFLRAKKYRAFNLSKKILTPHLGEFSLMIGKAKSEIEKDLLKYGRMFVKETKSHLVLKGPRTIIFLPNGEALINTSGNVGLAKFGTGDVLTGILAGLISQLKNLESAAIVGNYLHGLSADILANKKSVYAFTASEVMENLSSTILFLQKSFND